MTLSEDVSIGPAVVVGKEISARWTSLSESGELERTSSTWILVEKIRTDPTTSFFARCCTSDGKLVWAHQQNPAAAHWQPRAP